MKKNLLGLMLCVSSSVFSQLNSMDFSMAFVNDPVFTAGLDEFSKQKPVFQVSVLFDENDLNSLGTLHIMIYDKSGSTLVGNVVLDQQQVLSGLYTYRGMLVFNFSYLNPAGTYKVILDIQNTQQAYLPRVEKNFPTN